MNNSYLFVRFDDCDLTKNEIYAEISNPKYPSNKSQILPDDTKPTFGQIAKHEKRTYTKNQKLVTIVVKHERNFTIVSQPIMVITC